MKPIEDFVGKVIQGDCLEVMKQMPDKSVDLVLTDPPYGINFQSNYRINKHSKILGDGNFPVHIFDDLFRIASRAVYVFCRWDNLRQLPKPKSVLCWVKNNWSMGDLKHEHGRQWEACCFYPMENHEFIERIPDVIFSNRTGNELHPTQKPIEVIEKIISANRGGVILDCFLGSGTTAVAAERLGRKWIGIELDPKYCAIAQARIDAERAQLKMF